MNLAIVAITPGGADLARDLAESLPHAEVFLPERFRRDDARRYFAAPVAEVLPGLFAEADALVCIMATGIVVRVLAPHLRDKTVDPAVVVLDEAGSFAISLLSGHLGGANELARKVAGICGGQAVVTTATDVNGLPAWDEVARQEGLGVEPATNIRTLNSLLLRGESIALVDRQGRVASRYADVPGVSSAATFAAALQADVAGRVFVTHRLIPDLERQRDLLVLRPRDLVVGIGCNRGTGADEIGGAVEAVLGKAFLSPMSIGCLASIEAKRSEEGLIAYAHSRKLPTEFHPAAALNAVPVVSAPSAHALQAVGATGVCEPAALLSAAGGRLLVRKQKCGNVTVAVAEKI